MTKASEFNEADQNQEESESNTDIISIISFNEVFSNLLIKTENNLYHCCLRLNHNNNEKDEKEYNCDFILNYSLSKSIFNIPKDDVDYWKKKIHFQCN